MEVTGEIWAGVLIPPTPKNGPKGWENRVEYDVKFPLHGVPTADPFCLLGKLKNYFYIGDRLPPTRYIAFPESGKGLECPLYLRINDDTPGNGSGAFNCHIRIWGTPAPILVVKVQPYPITFATNQTQTTATITVHAEDSKTHAQVSGRVIVDGQDRGSTDVPITYTFQIKSVRVFDPDLKKWTYDDKYSSGKVSASGYPDTPIDFGF